MARRTATAALAGIGSRWHQRRDVHPTERVPPHSMPQPCTAFRVAPWTGSHRSFRHRHTLRRLPWGIGRPGPRAEVLRLCRLRSLAVATPESSAPTSGIATRPLRLHACSSRCRTTPPKLVVITPLPLAGGAAGTLPYAYAYASVSLCRCHALSAAQAVHSCHISGREVFSSVNFTSFFVRDADASSGGGSLMPHRHPFPRPGYRCRSRHHIAARRPRRYASECELPLSTARNLAVRADRPHTHPSYCCGCTLQSL